MPKRIFEGATPQERAQKRQALGTLRQLTVQPSTRQRYDKAVDNFLKFLRLNNLRLPAQRDLLDPMVCDFLEHLWSSGAGRAVGSDTVAGLQDFDPKLRHKLPGSWRLLKTWAINEVPNRAPPLPEHVVHAMCGWACFHKRYSFAVSLLVGFYGMLRTGEILNVRRSDFVVDLNQRKVLLALGLTKAGKRVGAAESVVLGFDVVVTAVRHWISLAKSRESLTPAPAKWRAIFNECLEALKITSYGFRPYSLRRGGATHWFGKHHSLDRLLLDGRWQAAKTARIYINEGLSILAQINLPRNDTRLTPFLTVFTSTMLKPKFTTLEPPVRTGRTGGRGIKPKKSKSGRKKGSLVCLLSWKFSSFFL